MQTAAVDATPTKVPLNLEVIALAASLDLDLNNCYAVKLVRSTLHNSTAAARVETSPWMR